MSGAVVLSQATPNEVTAYLERLVASRLVRKHPVRDVYMLTVKGRRYRREYAEYRRLNKNLTAEKGA